MEDTTNKKSNQELFEEAMKLLHILEDRTGYQDNNLGKAINLLQEYKLPE